MVPGAGPTGVEPVSVFVGRIFAHIPAEGAAKLIYKVVFAVIYAKKAKKRIVNG